MTVPFYSLAMGVVTISVVHALMPHHWLPFVVVGRKSRWTTRKTLWLLSLGAFVHTLSTILVGVLVGYLGQQMEAKLTAYHGLIPGIILFAFGSGYFLSSFTHRYCRHVEPPENMMPSSLIVMLGLSPCAVVAPFFIFIGPLGLVAIIEVSVAMAVLSVLGMTLSGWLALKGLNSLKLEWLERNESRVMGALLMLLGVSSILI